MIQNVQATSFISICVTIPLTSPQRLRHALSSVLCRAAAIEIRPVLTATLAVHRAQRLDPRGLIARICKEQRDDAVRWYA